MATVNHVLIATDGSESALKAAAFAGDLARALGARISVLFVQDDAIVVSGAWGEGSAMSVEQVREGLVTMSQDSNPGRSNLYEVKGFEVVVDFAHNPQAMQALFAMARAVPAKRRALCFGQAGDRTDEQIRELARSAWSIGIEMAHISELEHYRRGREAGEVYSILRDELIKSGARDDQVRHFDEEADSFDAALEWARDGDLVVILDLGRTSNIHEKLVAFSQERV